MTIAGLSTNISTSGITNDIQIAMLKKNLDTVETAGADIQSPCTQFSMYMGFIFF